MPMIQDKIVLVDILFIYDAMELTGIATSLSTTGTNKSQYDVNSIFRRCDSLVQYYQTHLQTVGTYSLSITKIFTHDSKWK